MTGNEAVVAQGVVVGADGSDPNLAALTWAADAAAAHGLPLTLLHARPDAAGAVQEVHEGSPVLDAFRGLLVGSTAMHVAPYAQCPVVVVHPEYAEAAEGPHVGDVVLGYDGSSAANRASAFAFRHAQAVGAAVVAVSVESRRGDPEVHDVQPEAAVPGSDTGAFHAPLLVTAGSFPNVPVQFVTGSGRPAAVLNQESIGCELLVVGMRGLGGFSGLVMGSVSQKVLTYATCPVAIVHEAVSARTAAGMPP